MPPTRSRRALLVALLLLPACGGSGEVFARDDTRGGDGIVRIDFQGTQPDYHVGSPSLYHAGKVEGLELPDGWEAGPAEAVTLERETRKALEGPWSAIFLRGKGYVSLKGPFDPSQFNRVVANVSLPSKADLRIELWKNDRKRALLRTQATRIEGNSKPQTVVLDVPGTLQMAQQVDELRLSVTVYGEHFALLGVDLMNSPLASWLPVADHGPRPVQLGAESRHAIGLSSLNPLEARVVGLPDSSLRLAFGRPLRVLRRGEALAIEVDVRGEDGRQVGGALLPLPQERNELNRWQEGEVKLHHEPGEELTVRLSLKGADPGQEALCAIASPRLERDLENPISVVLITSDTQRADHLGSGGKVKTPFLDRLAKEGIRFSDCLSATNITNPSHASILSGLSTRDTGIVDNITALADEASTLSERFQAAGFYTLAAMSAQHMNHEQSGLGQGFDQVIWPQVKAAEDSAVTLAPLETWLDESPHRALFVWLHIFDAHAPYNAPEEYRWLYYDKQRDPYDPDLPQVRGRAKVTWDTKVRDLTYVVAQYRSEVTYLDEQLAGFLAHPRLANAIIAMTADHGEHLGSHGLYWTHQGLYPETLAVPLILSWPGGPRGVVCDAAVNQLDLGRTLLDLAGAGWADFPGRNLLRWVEQPDMPAEARYAISSHGLAASISYEGWFLVLNLKSHSVPKREEHQVELYRPAQDPTCSTDLVDEEFEQARILRTMLIDWLAAGAGQTFARKAGVCDPKVLEQLAALGYTANVDGDEPASGGEWYTFESDNTWDERFGDQ
jgi:arylsulfatase A-like enzyme